MPPSNKRPLPPRRVFIRKMVTYLFKLILTVGSRNQLSIIIIYRQFLLFLMKIYNFRSNTGNALNNLFGLCFSSNVVNILCYFASPVSKFSGVLLFSVCAMNFAGITKPVSLFLLPITFILMELLLFSRRK